MARTLSINETRKRQVPDEHARRMDRQAHNGGDGSCVGTDFEAVARTVLGSSSTDRSGPSQG